MSARLSLLEDRMLQVSDSQMVYPYQMSLGKTITDTFLSVAKLAVDDIL